DAAAPPTPLEAANARMALGDATVAGLREAAASGDAEAVAAYNAAVAQQGADLAQVLGGLSEADRAAFLEGGGAAHISDTLRAAQESGDPATLTAVVQSIVGASEGIGDVDIMAVADAVREVGLDALGPEIRQALQTGAGAKLAVELAYGGDSLSSSPAEVDFAWGVGQDLQEIDARFGSSAEVADTLRSQRAQAVARMSAAGLTAEEIAAWEADFDAQHRGEMEAYEADAALYASTLEGRALGQSMHGEFAPFSLQNAGALANSEAGGRAVAEALLRSGQGADSWLDMLPGDVTPEERERLVTQGAMQGVGALAATGDIQGISALLQGFENNGGDAAALQGLRDRLGQIDASGLDGPALREAILGAFQPGSGASDAERTLLQRLGVSADIGTQAGIAGGVFGNAAVGSSLLGDVMEADGVQAPGSLGRLATGFSAVSSLINVLQTNPQDVARLGLAGAQFGFDAISLLAEIPRGVGLGVGAAFSVIGAALCVRDGNYAAAGAALLPVIGMGIGAIIGGPLGAAIGGGIGSLANAVLGALGVLGPSDEIAPLIIPAITDALVARGANPATAAAMAESLAGAGMGEKFTYTAATMGLTAEELLNQLATAPRGYATWFLDGMSSNVNFGEEGTPFQRTPDQSFGSDVWFETIWALSPEALAEMGPRGRSWDGHPLFVARQQAEQAVRARNR
ncbi:MAG: hypothetical protein KC621_30015, partial [Myxococcales bacterium]|nr:hypothetical protein [Myxococcales bacterium]